MVNFQVLDNLKKRWKIQLHKLRYGVYIDIHTQSLKNNVEFILHNLPKPVIKGIEIIEDIFDRDAYPHQVILKETMSAIDVKREIGKYVFREKRWPDQENVAKKLLAQEMIDLETFRYAYDTMDYLKIYEAVNFDVFAVYYGNDSMKLQEVAHAINMLYIKDYTDRNFSQQNAIDNLVDQLFNEESN
ncbi:hypothetical protein CN918_28055 [Priestia megaterium]|nr:hypothetical protein CN918_28055 [Priestia megaterium]